MNFSAGRHNMAKQAYQWDAGTIEISPPANAPQGCPPAVLTIGTVTVQWGEDSPPALEQLKGVARTTLLNAWNMHPGVAVTLVDESTFRLSIQKLDVTANRLAAMIALSSESDAEVVDTAGRRQTVPYSELPTVVAFVQTKLELLLDKYDAALAAIEAAETAEELSAVDLTL
jgi:hypothetical protein